MADPRRVRPVLGQGPQTLAGQVQRPCCVDFKKFDTNNDNLTDYNELSKMLDMVMDS